MPAAVAIAVVSWNTKALLDDCLRSLRADHEAGRAEVWVVDNGSTDGSPELVEAEHPWVRLHRSDENLGYGPAVNVVAGLTTTPFVAAANSDLRFEPDALGELLACAAREPRAGSFAPQLIMPGGRTQHSVHPFPTVRTGLLLSTGLALRGPIARRLPMEGHWDASVERDVPWAHGALLMVRREAWDDIGGFDPDQWFYAEDIDIALRLLRAGWRTRYVPSARVHHEVSASAADRWSDGERAIRTQRSTYAWLAHRRGLAYARAVALAHLLGPSVRAAALTAASRLAGRYRGRAAVQRRYVAMHRTGLESRASLDLHRRGR